MGYKSNRQNNGANSNMFPQRPLTNADAGGSPGINDLLEALNDLQKWTIRINTQLTNHGQRIVELEPPA